MHRLKLVRLTICSVLLVLTAVAFLEGQQSVTSTSEKVNKKMVKLFGAGGFKGLPSYGTGVLVSHDGYVLTVNNHILATADLRVHLADGRMYHAKVVVKEPELDVALIKIDADLKNMLYYDLEKASRQPLAEPGQCSLPKGAGGWYCLCQHALLRPRTSVKAGSHGIRSYLRRIT